jgi:alkanesulfonate monooxygenase SsuD/methylene tetrahydromethanopterin reductase-like flavin-dependent oxidoreductase (luciferase family)
MTDEGTKVGILLATRGLVMRAQREGRPADPGVFLDLAERAEAAGLDSVWVGDSLVSKPRLEPVAALAAIAARTSRVRIGTAVMLPAIRHPVTLAHSLATVDVLSRGRLVLGLGVGGAFTPDQERDWTSVGVAPRSRAARLGEMVRLMKRLWTEDEVSFQGTHFQVEGVSLHPKPVQPGGVPLLLAAHHRTGSEAQYRRAARYGDGIMGITDEPEEYARVAQRVMMLAAEEGRDTTSLERVFYMTVHIDDDEAVALSEADDFLMAYYGVRHWAERWGPWGPAKAVAARMRAYADAGAQHLIVRFASWDQQAQFERFEREVLPAFRAMPSAAS